MRRFPKNIIYPIVFIINTEIIFFTDYKNITEGTSIQLIYLMKIDEIVVEIHKPCFALIFFIDLISIHIYF